MLDAQYANVYYNDSLAGTHLVYPTDGKRLDNNQIWGNYEAFNNYGNYPSDYGGWCSNGTYNFAWRFVGHCISKPNYKGGDTIYNMSWGTNCWNNSLHNEIGRSTYAQSCYKNTKGWHWFFSGSKRINNLLDNPCTTLPIGENWIADYNNLRCYRNYQVDSGWTYSLVLSQWSYYSYNLYLWKGAKVCITTASSCTVGNSTYFKGAWAGAKEYGEQQSEEYYYVKKVDNITEYKAFNSFWFNIFQVVIVLTICLMLFQ